MTTNNGSISLKTPTHHCEDSRKKCTGKLLTTVLRHLWKLHAGYYKVLCSRAHTLAFTQSSLMSPQTVKSFRRLSRHLKTTRNSGEMPTCLWAVLSSTTAYVNINWVQPQLNPELSSNSALSLSCFDNGQTPPGFCAVLSLNLNNIMTFSVVILRGVPGRTGEMRCMHNRREQKTSIKKKYYSLNPTWFQLLITATSVANTISQKCKTHETVWLYN